MPERNLRELLATRQEEIDSLLCVGLDPLLEKLPAVVSSNAESEGSPAVYAWMREIVDVTVEYASMFKPNIAHWEAIEGGSEALQALIAHIHLRHPMVPVFVDCKRGDIGPTQSRNRKTVFEILKADGMNYNGYLGSDALEALIDPQHPDRALVGLGRTSNPRAWQVQDRRLADGRRVWEAMVEDILSWSEELGVIKNAGVVMGAAHADPHDETEIVSWHLEKACSIVGNSMWFLIPGVGTQQGFVRETVRAAYRGPGTVAINSSSGICLASSGPDYAEAAARAAKHLRDEVNLYR